MAAASPKNWRDKVWLVWFALQVLIVLFVDGVPWIYPAWLYQPEGSPLHFLQKLRDYDINTYNDPLIQEHMAPNFMPFLFFIEIAFQLPVALYSVRRLGRGGGEGTTGAYELLLLLYAFETAFSTMLCMNHAAYLDPADFTPAQRDAFWYQLMGPWVAFPLLMFVDMYWRLYRRVSAADVVAAKKKQ